MAMPKTSLISKSTTPDPNPPMDKRQAAARKVVYVRDAAANRIMRRLAGMHCRLVSRTVEMRRNVVR